jgi:putative tricarboxylic transport membrane protein
MKADSILTLRGAILAVSSFCAILGILYLVQAFRYPLGEMGRPGPGAFPLFAGAILLIGSLGAIVKTLVRPPEGELEWPKGAGAGRMGLVAVGSLIYAIGLEYLGHIPACAIVSLAALHAMGLRSWPLKILIAAVMAFGSFLLFATVLRVPLPGGIIQSWLQGG